MMLREVSYRQKIATAHSSSILFLNSNVMHVHACTVIHRCLLDALRLSLYILRYDGEELSISLMPIQSGTHCVRNTFKHLYEFASSSIMARYTTCVVKEVIQVKALPKLVLYEKYGTQKEVSRRNI